MAAGILQGRVFRLAPSVPSTANGDASEMGGRYGFTIPGYFAYDDIAVRFDK